MIWNNKVWSKSDMVILFCGNSVINIVLYLKFLGFNMKRNICKLVKGVPVPLRHKIFTHMRRVEFSINYSAFRDFKQVSLQE